MNFRDLEYVIETANNLSFTKAAEVCNVSQPSLSTQIKKLEGELGIDIFIRNKKKVHLTDFGEVFVEKAKTVLSLREDMKRTAIDNKNTLEGEIRLGAILTIAPYVFPTIVTTIQNKAPNISLSLREAKTEELIENLLNGKIDVALISLPSDENIFETRSIFKEPFYIAVSEKHPLAKRKMIEEKDLKNIDLVLLEEGHCFRKQALDVCHSMRAKENHMFTATSLETIRHFIEKGTGATLMPAMAIRKHDGLKYIPFKNKKFEREVGFIWKKSNPKKPHIEKIIKIIEQSLQ